MQKRRNKFFLILLSLVFTKPIFASSLDKDFIKSFVQHYEFNAEGRYAHEYHPALLDKTACSLDGLEESLSDRGFKLLGRRVICGYEENAVSTYYTDYKQAKINDEASSKNKVGWSLRLHNRFGFMTGFLFKDFNFFAKHWFKDKNPIFEHIDPDDIEIFDDRATVFQEHAFGQALPLILSAQDSVIKNFKHGNFRAIFEQLIKFWTCMYRGEIKFGNKQVAGTQDILFSIENAKHLVRSKLPMLNCFIGPDITYPIEVSVSQPREATIHAQHFAKTFAERLTPMQDSPTAYVFCSFVDGVGKSTLLGNVKNYYKYGDEVESYERVDNSSSQLAEIFELKENVFIADLPAQVSHFTYKPDGFVYVDIQRELEAFEVNLLQDFVRDNKDEFRQNYDQELKCVKEKIDLSCALLPELNNIEQPAKAFLRNVILTKKEKTNRWIPFDYHGKHCLYNFYKPSQIRMLVPLGLVQSEGLKNIETEQMLFFQGVRLPLPYNEFLDDFIKKLKDNGIQNIIFVDFISMYPRSSRENIRVNYLLQQLALLDDQFDSKYSLYRDFVNEVELFSILGNKEGFEKILSSFELETVTRLALFNIIIKREHGDLSGFSMVDLTALIQKEISKILQEQNGYLKKIAREKLKSEHGKLEYFYGLTKAYINTQQFSFSRVAIFSDNLTTFFTRNIYNDRINTLWQDPGVILGDKRVVDSCKFSEILKTENGVDVQGCYVFDFECKDEAVLTPFIRTLRSCWYASLANLLDATHLTEDDFTIKKEHYFVPPMFLKLSANKRAYLVQPMFDEWDEKVTKKSKEIETVFNLEKVGFGRWGCFEDEPYYLDWKSMGTNSNMYAFDCDMSVLQTQSYLKSVVTFLVQKYKKETDQSFVLPTTLLLERLQDSQMWKYERKDMIKRAKKNGAYGKEKNKPKKPKNNMNPYYGQYNKNIVEVFLGQEENKPAARMLVRMLATLEMVLKDPDADIAVRFGDRQDFSAAIKLFEKVTLPKHFGILFEHDLFDNYDYVEPYPSWDEWSE